MKHFKLAFNYKNNILPIFLFVICFFLTAAWLLPIRYEENDDIAMLWLSSGFYTGEPQARLVFINYYYGIVLKFFYENLKGVEWYTLFFLFLHLISLSVILYFINLKAISRYIKLIFVFLFCAIELRFISNFQFTTTAAITSLAGLLIIYQAQGKHKLVGIMLFIIACLIRFEASILVFIVLSPVFLYEWIPFKKICFSQTNIYLICAILSAVSFKYFDYQKYQTSSDWQYYHSYNLLRGKIHDNPNFEALKKEALPNNISELDLQLLKRFLIDANVFNINTIAHIHGKINEVSFLQKCANVFKMLKAYSHFLVLIAFIGLLIFWGTVDKINRTLLLLSVLLFALLFIFISVDGNLKYRVFYSACLPLFYVFFNSVNFKSNRYLMALAVFIVIFGVYFTQATIQLSKKHKNIEPVYEEQKNLLNNYLKTSNQCLIPLTKIIFECSDPFAVSSQFPSGKLLLSGWLTNLPHNQSQFNSFKQLVNKHAVFIGKHHFSLLEDLKNNIEQNYRIQLKTQTIMESENFAIINFHDK